MAKIEIEIDDEMLAHVPPTGRSLEELVRKGLELALWEHESQSLLERWMDEQEEERRRGAQEHAQWIAAQHEQVAASFKILSGTFRLNMDRQREAALTLTEEQAATFAWLCIVTRALSKRLPIDDLRIDLDNPTHWQAAQDYARHVLYQHFKKERATLERGEHPLLSPETEDSKKVPDRRTGPANGGHHHQEE